METVQAVLLTLSALAGAAAAWAGLFTWRKQLIGRTEYEVARRLLRAVLQVRDQVSYVRGRFMSSGEIAIAAEEEGLDLPALGDAKGAEKAAAAARNRRWRRLDEAMTKLRVEQLESEVLWGTEVRRALEPLQRCVSALNAATREYREYVHEGPLEGRDDRERWVELRRTLYGSGGPDDPFAGKVTAAVEGIEEFIRPHLKS